MRRGRNIIIKNIPESAAEQPLDRIKSDKKWIIALCDLKDDEIIRYYRVGKSTNELPKLLAVTLCTPEAAKECISLVIVEKSNLKEIYTAAERVANYKSRQVHNKRIAIAAGVQPVEHGKANSNVAVASPNPVTNQDLG